jgi:glycosyltransferase involved in cell wall biosynthesis
MTMLSVVIPAYNEENGIADIMQRVLAVRGPLVEAGIERMELIVVNDGSKDRTAQIATEIAEKSTDVRIISQTNGGYGAALKTGFNEAKGELIGFLDADGTYPPEYFPQLCKSALQGSDLVIGSRMAGADSKMPLTRRIGNIFFASLLSLLGTQKVSDSASGMRVFKRQILECLLPLPDGLNLTPVMSTRAVHEHIQINEVPIPYSERVGRSKLSVVRDGRVFLQSMVWTVLLYNPVRILGMMGFICFCLSALVGVGLVIARLSGITQLNAWGVIALVAGMVFGVTGVSLFALGTTFNYLVSLFYKRPVRRGLLGRPLFKQRLESQFGWIGIAAMLVGLIVAIVSIILGIRGWEMDRLWFYLFSSAMILLIGFQFFIFWILARVLEELSQNEVR